MWKVIVGVGALSLLGVILRKTHILEKSANTLFSKVDKVTSPSTVCTS